MKDYTRGSLINLFYHDGQAWKTFAYSTSSSMEMSNELSEVASKDFGLNPHQSVNKSSWSFSGEYLFSPANATIITDMLQKGKIYSFAFAVCAETDYASGLKPETGVGTQDSWSIGSTFVKYGDVVVTQASVTASNGEVATISLTLTSSGALSNEVMTTINSYTTDSTED
jgi:hypothetical protein